MALLISCWCTLNEMICQRLQNRCSNSVPIFTNFYPSKFITTQFDIVEKTDLTRLKCPVKVTDELGVELWHFYGEKKTRQAGYYLCIKPSAKILSDTNGRLMLSLLNWMLVRKLAPILEDAVECYLSYSCEIDESYSGINIQITGLSQKLSMILITILTQLKNILMSSSASTSEFLPFFNRAKNEFGHESLVNIYTPDAFAESLLESLGQSSSLHPIFTKEALTRVCFCDFGDFCRNFNKSCTISGLAYGNLSEGEVGGVGVGLKNYLGHDPTFRIDLYDYEPLNHALEYLSGETILRVQSLLDDKINNSAIINSYQLHRPSPKSILICKIVKSMMMIPIFNFLRQECQLGYVLTIDFKITLNSTASLNISIHSSSAKFSGMEVCERINEFLCRFYNVTLSKMSDEGFNEWKEIEETNNQSPLQIFNQIKNKTINSVHTSSIDEEKMMNKLRISEVKEWYRAHLLPSNSPYFKLLSIQVVGNADTDEIFDSEKTEYLYSFHSQAQNFTGLTLIFPSNLDEEKCKNLTKKTYVGSNGSFLSFTNSLPKLPQNSLLSHK